MNKLYGVGVGPGDPELMTIKALNAIKKSKTIITIMEISILFHLNIYYISSDLVQTKNLQ